MRIRIRSFAGFRNILGKESEIDLLGEDGKLREDENIFISGKNIHSLQSLQTPLANGDEVALFTAAIGG